MVRPTTTLQQTAAYARSIALSLREDADIFSREDMARYADDLAEKLEHFSAIAERGGWTGPFAELFPLAREGVPHA